MISEGTINAFMVSVTQPEGLSNNMAKVKNVINDVKHDIRTDYNWNRAARLSKDGARALPSASLYYALDKFPIIGWLPRYDLRWIINDLIAGITVGLMLIPQSLSYAKIAGIPVEAGLASSWLPATLYAFMGTTKGLSNSFLSKQKTYID